MAHRSVILVRPSHHEGLHYESISQRPISNTLQPYSSFSFSPPSLSSSFSSLLSSKFFQTPVPFTSSVMPRAYCFEVDIGFNFCEHEMIQRVWQGDTTQPPLPINSCNNSLARHSHRPPYTPASPVLYQKQSLWISTQHWALWSTKRSCGQRRAP